MPIGLSELLSYIKVFFSKTGTCNVFVMQLHLESVKEQWLLGQATNDLNVLNNLNSVQVNHVHCYNDINSPYEFIAPYYY